MGDNYRRARAYPRIEVKCPDCDRWLAMPKSGKTPRHLCGALGWSWGLKPAMIYNPGNPPKPTLEA